MCAVIMNVESQNFPGEKFSNPAKKPLEKSMPKLGV
jgi:hypothetical protein